LATLRSQAAPASSDPAAEFVQISADIEILQWGPGLGGTKGPNSQSFQVNAVVGRNKWFIEHRAFGTTNQYSFDGTKLVERTWLDSRLSASDPVGPTTPGRWWTRTSDSPDGNPSETTGISDHLDLVSRIAWLAFCSGPTLNNPQHKLYPPWEFWKEGLDPSNFVEKVDRFEDDLGVPRTVLIFSGEDQPALDYRVPATTNVAGWLFPQSFYLLEYNPILIKGWTLILLAHGTVSSIAPAADPLPMDTATSQPQSHTLRFAAISPSKVHVEGSSDVHDWSLETTNVVGFLELNRPLFGSSPQQAGRPGPSDLQAEGEFFFPVRYFTSGYSTPMFSNKADQAVLHHALRTTENPNIIYRLHHLTATNDLSSKPSTLLLQSTGEVALGGVTNPISIPLHVTRQDDTLTFSGSTSVRLSDFGIEPPSAQGKGWTVKVGNTVEPSFEIHLKRVEPR
jgi:hypothetical protein